MSRMWKTEQVIWTINTIQTISILIEIDIVSYASLLIRIRGKSNSVCFFLKEKLPKFKTKNDN